MKLLLEPCGTWGHMARAGAMRLFHMCFIVIRYMDAVKEVFDFDVVFVMLFMFGLRIVCFDNSISMVAKLTMTFPLHSSAHSCQ